MKIKQNYRFKKISLELLTFLKATACNVGYYFVNLLYNDLILPHLNKCLLSWGGNSTKTFHFAENIM